MNGCVCLVDVILDAFEFALQFKELLYLGG